MADEPKFDPEHVQFGNYLYESGVLATVFEGEKDGLEKIALLQAAFTIMNSEELPRSLRDRVTAIDYLTEMGILTKDGNVYHYNQ